jgi:hypothetical protein
MVTELTESQKESITQGIQIYTDREEMRASLLQVCLEMLTDAWDSRLGKPKRTILRDNDEVE